MSVFPELSPPYSTLVVDPPWHYDHTGTMLGKHSGPRVSLMRPLPYSTLSVEEIAALPVGSLAADHAWLFLWTTNKYLPSAFDVLATWGFGYRQTLVWHKTGSPSPFGGTAAPNHAEFLLLAARGRPRSLARWPGSVVSAPKQRVHSRKPPVFADLVEQFAPGPYVELFARSPRLGWDSWGYGFESERAS